MSVIEKAVAEKASAHRRSEGSSANAVNVRSLSKFFRRQDKSIVPAINDVSLDVEPGEFVVLLGPSGCGKTTLLRCIAGLEKPDRGTILMRNEVVYASDRNLAVPTEDRAIGMVFQSYALWPHLSVFENVAYPLHARGVPASAIGPRVLKALETVGIPELRGQHPGQISGGQQQRVALARAIVPNSDLVLFDEPLSNVDAKVREQLRGELLSMQRTMGFAALYVTHDQTEAMALGHRIAVMRRGEIAQLGRSRDIYDAPVSRYVAHFVGITNELRGRSPSLQADGKVKVATEIGEIVATASAPMVAGAADVALVFRPERCVFSAREPAAENKWLARLESSLFLGSHVEHVVRVGAHAITVWTVRDIDVPVQGTVWLSIETEHVRAVPWED